MKPIHLILFAITTLIISSCNIQINQTNGNGNIVSEERTVSENFDIVKGSSGLDIFLTQGSENKITVEADENLMQIIETEIDNGTLSVKARENIGRSTSKKVYITYTHLAAIEASSGADIIANSVLEFESFTLEASSGADLTAEVFVKDLYARASSGADLHITGKAGTLQAKASSGSDLNAKDLYAVRCNAEASSGADITVHVKENLEVKASSGGDIEYYGDPAVASKQEKYSGNVKKM